MAEFYMLPPHGTATSILLEIPGKSDSTEGSYKSGLLRSNAILPVKSATLFRKDWPPPISLRLSLETQYLQTLQCSVCNIISS